MKQNPKVSIITVVYNDVNNIEKSIINTTMQTYDNIEYIIIDGGSDDGTVEIVNKYIDKISLFVTEPDRGIYDAMNKGAELATGEWLLFHNCGDYFVNKDVVSEVFDNFKDQGEELIGCNVRYFKEYGYKDLKPAILYRHYYESMPLHHQSTFIRRELQLSNPYNLQYKNSADYDFFVKCFKNGVKYTVLNVLLTLFDNRTGATTEHFDLSLKENYEIIKESGASPEYLNKISSHLKRIERHKYLSQMFPFYHWLRELHSKYFNGWIRSNLEETLKDVRI